MEKWNVSVVKEKGVLCLVVDRLGGPHISVGIFNALLLIAVLTMFFALRYLNFL